MENLGQQTKPSHAERSHLLGLYELLEKIFSHLDFVDVLRFQGVCKDWQAMIQDSPVLQRKLFLLPQSRAMLDDEDQIGLQFVKGSDYAVAPCGTPVKLHPLLDKLWPKLLFHEELDAGPWNELFCDRHPVCDHEVKFARPYGDLPNRLSVNVTVNSILGGRDSNISIDVQNATCRVKRSTIWKGQSWENMYITQPPVRHMRFYAARMTDGFQKVGAHLIGACRSGTLIKASGITLGTLNRFERRLDTDLYRGVADVAYLQLNFGNVRMVNKLAPYKPKAQSQPKLVEGSKEAEPAPLSLLEEFNQNFPKSPKDKALSTEGAPGAPSATRYPPLEEQDFLPLLGVPRKLRKLRHTQWDWNKVFGTWQMENIITVNDALVSMRLAPVVWNDERGFIVADDEYLNTHWYREDYMLSAEGFDNLQNVSTTYRTRIPAYQSYYEPGELDAFEHDILAFDLA